MNLAIAESVIAPFYDALNRPATKDIAALVRGCTSAEWRSFSGDAMSKGRDEFVQQVVGFGKLIPDLTWTIKEILVDGDKIVVRSEAAGTPAAEFFGVPYGGHTFRIMTIDIHTVQDGMLIRAYHVEDWAIAIRQLSAK